MTVSGTVDRAAAVLAGLTVAAGFGLALPARWNALVAPVILIAGVLAFAAMWRPRLARLLAVPYALLEGVALGVITRMAAAAIGGGLVLLAVGATLAITASALLLYRTGLVKVSARFTRIVAAATLGVALTFAVDLLLSLVHVRMPVVDSHGPAGIAFAAVVVALAAANLIVDLDFIASRARFGAPKEMEWYAAMSLAISLVWLYISVLRLIVATESRN
jgi:uncharacterized YccA/Bax inhibitor family protein